MAEEHAQPAAEVPDTGEGAYDRIAIVTGGDSGIGRATTMALAAAGFDVGITFHSNEDGAQGVTREVRRAGRGAVARRIDLKDPPSAARVIEEIAEELGGLGVLVNNAGVESQHHLVDTGYEEWRNTLAVNLDGPFMCSQRAARSMADAGRGGRIINVTSVHEGYPKIGFGPYCAAKGGLLMLTRVLALELSAHGITVNAVAPGEIATPMTGQEDAAPQPGSRPGYPLARPGQAHEVAAAIAFLAGPESSYLTGASLTVDGGLTMMGPQAGGLVTTADWRTG